jgi:SpoIID/LytB domain protein
MPSRLHALPLVGGKSTESVFSLLFVLFLVFFHSFAANPSLASAVALARPQTEITDADLERASAGRSIVIGSPATGGRATTVPLEVYVARVLAGEAEQSAPDAALQALAIAVRTFAIFNAGRHRRDGYDLCDTTHCQVPRSATPATRAAAVATAGRILTYKGSVAEVFYSASCGGRSENAAHVWPGVDLPYLRSVVDDVHADDVPWTLEMTLRDVQQALAANGFAGSRLTEVRVDERNESGRVMRLRLRGLQPDVIAGDQFRMAIGTREIRSTAFSVAREGNTLRFTGRGYGHGVGMCVIGAARRARRGESADTILTTYYPGAVVDSAPVSLVRATTDAGAAPVVARPPSPLRGLGETGLPKEPAASLTRPTSGIMARVPKESIISATELERQATRARDSLSKALGTSVTPITIELHESLDRFRDVTGRPWWVSAVASGTAIDLAPAAVLEQRGGVEPVLRQAMAELFVAPTLVNRPVWVKVGAARYFARTKTAAPAAGNVRCPADAELTLAISAAAQREAEARAESCFARAIAHTHDWRAVR